MELITYFFVLYRQHGRRDVKCKLSINRLEIEKRLFRTLRIESPFDHQRVS